jgi:hypothetical protein
VINMQGARGVDYVMSSQALALGGGIVRLTGTAETATVTQALNRVARAGQPGHAVIYASATDRAVTRSPSPGIRLVTVRYAHAAGTAAAAPASPAARHDLLQAQRQLAAAVPALQAEADARIGVTAPPPPPPPPPPAPPPALPPAPPRPAARPRPAPPATPPRPPPPATRWRN